MFKTLCFECLKYTGSRDVPFDLILRGAAPSGGRVARRAVPKMSHEEFMRLREQVERGEAVQLPLAAPSPKPRNPPTPRVVPRSLIDVSDDDDNSNNELSSPMAAHELPVRVCTPKKSASGRDTYFWPQCGCKNKLLHHCGLGQMTESDAGHTFTAISAQQYLDRERNKVGL